MSAALTVHADDRSRIAVLWTCTGLFFLRVIGQIEALLVAPAWLPPMEQWYSGLLPYPLLLPAQIALLMLMSCIALRAARRHSDEQRSEGWQRVVRILAAGYFIAMALRLCIEFARGADDVIDAHGIPVAFHWVLALFLLVFARSARRDAERRIR